MAVLEIAVLLFSIAILPKASELAISASVRPSKFFSINTLTIGFRMLAAPIAINGC